MSTEPKMVMRGALGLRRDLLSNEHVAWLRQRLTVSSIPYKGQAATKVVAINDDGTYLWVPRFFDHLEFWPKVKHWDWVAPPLKHQFKQLMQPDPARKQPEAIEQIAAHLREHSGGIGVLPTGIGKTMVALSIAAKFKTPIAVFVYAGHMIDNWIEHAKSVLGLQDHEIGMVKEDRCDLDKPFTIISIQTILCRDLPDALYNQIGFVIADEVHHYAAARWHQVISKFPARYRLGMSADPLRDDGLDPVVRWLFGKVAYNLSRRPTGETPLVCLAKLPVGYEEGKYCDWFKDDDGHWTIGSPNAMKYDKLLMRDEKRNAWLVDKLVDARQKGRRILVFAKHRDHIKLLHDTFKRRWNNVLLALAAVSTAEMPETKMMCLWGGQSDKERREAPTADVIFTTHGYSREALNLPHIDTLFFATPPGDPLQPVGRLRDRGPTDRKSLLVLDPYEETSYAIKKAQRRKASYESLGLQVKKVVQTL